MKKLLGIVVLSLFLSVNVFANHFSYKVPEVKVKEFDRWMGKLKRKDGKWFFKSPKKFKKLDIDISEIPTDIQKILALEVDGIITDFPERVRQVLSTN